MGSLQEQLQPYLPLDKSWTIRMGILDLIHQRPEALDFLNQQEGLNDDLLALRNTLQDWPSSDVIRVGESGTLFRFLQYLSWKSESNKVFEKSGTLKHRAINDDPTVISWKQEQLLVLDNGTSQWASAAALCGDAERLDNPPFKLGVTYEAIDHWNEKRGANTSWEARTDQTITNQALAFLHLLETGNMEFTPEQAEDYCFARAFDLIDAEEGEARWPNLRGHESDRIAEMEVILAQAEAGQSIESRDHRVVQAYALLQRSRKKPIAVQHPEAVNKTWPQFWPFLDALPFLYI